MKLIETSINFGGFYESIHDTIVTEAVARDVGAENEETGEIDWNEDMDNYNDWKTVQIKYCKEWIDLFNEEFDTKVIFKGLDSPKEYNFRTDTIDTDISIKDVLTLFKVVKEQDLKKNVIDNLKRITTYRDGYIPWHDYTDMFKAENRCFVVEALIDELLKEKDKNDSYPFILEEFYI